MRELSAALFDMDGVVVDTEDSVRAFWERLALAEGFSLGPADMERHVYGHRADHTLRELFPQITPDRYDEVFRLLRDDQESLDYSPVPGAPDLLHALSAAGVPLALVTGAQDWKAKAVLGQLGLDGVFDVLICADDVPAGKPDPACYLLAADCLGVNIGHCLVFEDAVSGVTSALAAGASCVGLATPHRAGSLLALGATTTVRDFTELGFDPAGRALSVPGGPALIFGPVAG